MSLPNFDRFKKNAAKELVRAAKSSVLDAWRRGNVAAAQKNFENALSTLLRERNVSLNSQKPFMNAFLNELTTHINTKTQGAIRPRRAKTPPAPAPKSQSPTKKRLVIEPGNLNGFRNGKITLRPSALVHAPRESQLRLMHTSKEARRVLLAHDPTLAEDSENISEFFVIWKNLLAKARSSVAIPGSLPPVFWTARVDDTWVRLKLRLSYFKQDAWRATFSVGLPFEWGGAARQVFCNFLMVRPSAGAPHLISDQDLNTWGEWSLSVKLYAEILAPLIQNDLRLLFAETRSVQDRIRSGYVPTKRRKPVQPEFEGFSNIESNSNNNINNRDNRSPETRRRNERQQRRRLA